jgi:hypothetical protein
MWDPKASRERKEEHLLIFGRRWRCADLLRCEMVIQHVKKGGATNAIASATLETREKSRRVYCHHGSISNNLG